MTRHPFPTLALILSATALLPAGLHGQERIVPFVGAGAALGTGDLGENTGTGWQVFGGVDVPIGVPGLSVGTTASYARVPYDGPFDEVTNVTSLLGEVAYAFMAGTPGMVKPYVRGGAGVHVYRYDPGTITANATTLTRPGVSAGAGINILMGGATVFLGGRFLSGTDSGFVGFHGGVALR